MTLLISAFAAIISTVSWYFIPKRKELMLSVPCCLFWGATIMWFVDAIFEYAELGAEYFTPAVSDMINDAFLGFSVVALGAIIWVVILLIKDPMGVVKNSVFKKK